MSIFAGGCELPAFTAVCRDDDRPPVDELIDELVRTSFVTVDFAFKPTRYRLLEPIRQYARGLLDVSGERDDRRQRHEGQCPPDSVYVEPNDRNRRFCST